MAEAIDDDGDRREAFEAILRVLDENPKYVDEFFVQARGHTPTLDRFIQNAAQHLHEEDLARLTAKHLVRNPKGLRQILVASMEAARDEPEARAAIAGAIGDETKLATGILTDDPEVVRRTLIHTVSHVSHKPEARRAFVLAMHTASPALAEILANNPKLLTRMFEQLAGQIADDPALVKQLLDQLGE